MEKCPFKPGDIVVYAPTTRGRGLIIMTDLSKLEPGQKYKVAEIYEENYVVVEGFERAVPSGLFWTKFKSAESTEKK